MYELFRPSMLARRGPFAARGLGPRVNRSMLNTPRRCEQLIYSVTLANGAEALLWALPSELL